MYYHPFAGVRCKTQTSTTKKGIIMSKIKIYEAGEQLNRIANALDEILRLVKLDQEKMAKRFPEPETDELSKEWKHD